MPWFLGATVKPVDVSDTILASPCAEAVESNKGKKCLINNAWPRKLVANWIS